MKITGIILVILGVVNFILHIVAMSSSPEHADRAVRLLFFDVGLAGLGIYLIQRANKKKEKQAEKDKWNKKL
jgi:uncharacterized membrane protein